MLVDLEKHSDVCVLRLHGRFATGRDSAYLRDKTEELKGTGCSKIVADFTNVEYIDSTGIGFLIGIYTSVLKNSTGRFVLSNLNRRVREVLELTRLAQVMPIYPNEESALNAVRSAQGAPSQQAS